MFGLLKENILNNLEQVYLEKGEDTFKNEFSSFMTTIKKSNDLKEFYNIYSIINDVKFKDESTSKEFIEEAIISLKTLDKSKLSLLESFIVNKKELFKESREYYLDQLIFNKNISLKNKVEYKMNLVRSMVEESGEKVNFNTYITEVENKLNSKMENLTEEQIKIVTLFNENDSKNINDYYKNLINETQGLIDDRIIESKSKVELVNNLIDAKKKLKSLSEDASLSNIELILDLKSNF